MVTFHLNAAYWTGTLVMLPRLPSKSLRVALTILGLLTVALQAHADCNTLPEEINRLKLEIINARFDTDLARYEVALIQKYRQEHALSNFRYDMHRQSEATSVLKKNLRIQKQTKYDQKLLKYETECSP